MANISGEQFGGLHPEDIPTAPMSKEESRRKEILQDREEADFRQAMANPRTVHDWGDMFRDLHNETLDVWDRHQQNPDNEKMGREFRRNKHILLQWRKNYNIPDQPFPGEIMPRQ